MLNYFFARRLSPLYILVFSAFLRHPMSRQSLRRTVNCWLCSLASRVIFTLYSHGYTVDCLVLCSASRIIFTLYARDHHVYRWLFPSASRVIITLSSRDYMADSALRNTGTH